MALAEKHRQPRSHTPEVVACLVSVGLIVAVALHYGWLPSVFKSAHEGFALPESGDSFNKKNRDLRCIDNCELLQAIQSAKTTLVAMLKPDGQFIYEIDAVTGRESNLGYNLVRHSGAIYALAMYYQRYRDPSVGDAIGRASRFLVKNGVKPVGDETKQIMAVVSTPELSESKTRSEAGLGGTALGLIALLRARELDTEIVDPEVMIKLGRFLCYLQDEDGSFYTKYILEKKSKSRTNPSLYYPGEAILALTRLYKSSHDSQWLQAAISGMRHLANSRKENSHVPADNWALIATAELVSLGDQLDATDMALFKEHAAQIANDEISRQILNPTEEALYGCYNREGRTTPSSTRLEGILATLAYWPKEDVAFRTHLRASADAGIAFLLRAQIREGAQKGAFPESIEAVWSEPQKRFSRTPPSEIRIDFIQHALSALLRYQEIEELEHSK